jgi:hypothetical protein
VCGNTPIYAYLEEQIDDKKVGTNRNRKKDAISYPEKRRATRSPWRCRKQSRSPYPEILYT